MRANQITKGIEYAVKRSSGEIVCATYTGTKAVRNSWGGYSQRRLCFSYVPPGKVKKINFTVESGHYVLSTWTQYSASIPAPVETGDLDTTMDPMKEAMFSAKSNDIESLVWFLRTLEINADIGVVTSKTDDDQLTKEPALFIRYDDSLKMLQLVQKMGLYNLTESS